MLWGTRLAALSTLTTMMLLAPLARAQSDEERAAARTAATEGVTALEQGRFKDAVDLFKRAESIIHAPPHLLYMARAQAKLGNLVSAHETYLKVTRETLAEGAPRAFTDAQASAATELAALEPRIPSLKVDVSGATAEDVSLLIDGTPAPPATIGLARPIDPGEHKVQARTKGAASKVATVTIAEGAKETLSLVLEPVAVAIAPTNEPPSTEPSPPKRSAARTGGAIAALGVGAAGLVLGTISVVQNRGKRDDADALCTGGPCPASRRADIDALDADANAAATRAWIGYGVGIVGVGVGAVLLLTGSGESKTGSSGARPSAWMGPRSGGFGLRGEF